MDATGKLDTGQYTSSRVPHRFMQQSVKRKLVSAFSIMAVLMAAVGGFSLLTLKRLNVESVELLEKHQPILTHMNAIVSGTLFHSLKIDQYVATGNQAHLRMVQQLRQEVGAHLEALEGTMIEGEDKRLFTDIKEAFATYLRLSDTVKRAFETFPHDRLAIQDKQMRIAALLENGLLLKAKALHQSKEQSAHRLMAANSRCYQRSFRIVLAAGLVLTALAMTAALLISKSITRPIRHLVVVSKQVTQGDLTARATITSDDEFAYLARAFNSMTDQLQGLIDTLGERVAERTSKLMEEKNLVSTILQTADALVVVLDSQGRIVRFNTASERVTGYTFGEVANKFVGDLFWIPEEADAIMVLLDELRAGRFPIRNESHWRTKNGAHRTIAWSNACVINTAGDVEYMVGVGIDITEQKKAPQEKKLLQQQSARSKKMEALGLLASGVAHDLKNILSGIVSYPEMLLMRPDLDASMREELEAIGNSGKQAAEVVSDLLHIARGTAIARTTVNLSRLIKEFWTSPEFHKIKQRYPDITFSPPIEDDQLNIIASTIHVRKALMNLVVNAAEAFYDYHQSGYVQVTTSNVYLDRTLRGKQAIKNV